MSLMSTTSAGYNQRPQNQFLQILVAIFIMLSLSSDGRPPLQHRQASFYRTSERLANLSTSDCFGSASFKKALKPIRVDRDMLKWRNVSDASKMAAAPPDVTSETSAASAHVDSDIVTAACGSWPSSSLDRFQWAENVDKLEDFDNLDKLPCVGRIEEGVAPCADGQRQGLAPGLKIYAGQPLLMFSRVKKRQAMARTIYRDNSGVYLEIGQTVIVPDDYSGWFELVPPDFRRATCFRSIAEIADNMPRKFFTRSNLKVIRVEKGDDGESQYVERKVPAGSFLRTEEVVTAKWRTSVQTGVIHKKHKDWETQEVKYLKCIDSDQKEILIPLSHGGKFNAIYEKGKLNKHSVYSMKDILADLKLPVKVRLLFGKAPVVPCIFTGMLCVRDVREDDLIICSTILNRRNVLLDIPITTPCKVRLATREEDFSHLPTFVDAQTLCAKYAHMYSSMIKLSPELDTDQKVIQHVPSDPELAKQTGDALRALDLITDISLTDEPVDLFMESDTDSVKSDDASVMLAGTIVELHGHPDNGQSTTNA